MDKVSYFYGCLSGILDWKQLWGAGKSKPDKCHTTTGLEKIYFNKLIIGSLFLTLEHLYHGAARAEDFLGLGAAGGPHGGPKEATSWSRRELEGAV